MSNISTAPIKENYSEAILQALHSDKTSTFPFSVYSPEMSCFCNALNSNRDEIDAKMFSFDMLLPNRWWYRRSV